MKGTIVAAAAALLGSASASVHHRHEFFHKRANYTEVCATYTTTTTGELIWTPVPQCTKNCPATSSSSPPEVIVKTTATSSTPTAVPTTTTVKPTVTTEVPCTVPTLVVETCPTPGTYSFPATTVVVTETTTVCGASTTAVPSGTHTLGGVTTVVETATTITCPVATTSTASGGVVTSIIETTTYVCPSAGTYTIAPVTTTCTVEETVVVPVVTSFTPGTYTKPAVVTTVTETDYVVYCPFDVPSPTTTAVPVVPTTKVAVTTQPAVTTSPSTTKPAVVQTTSSSSTSSAPATSSSSTSSFPKLGGTGDQWAITYTPYTTSGQCKTKSEVLVDLQAIKAKGFTTIRVYSTDCDTLPNVGAGCSATGLKMIIGVFIGEVGCDNGNPDVASQVADIKAWAQWDLVELVVVGNEAGHNGYCTPSQLSSLVVEVKTIIKEAGCDVPVTTTDTVATWQDTEFASALCSVVDVVACNAHAYFNAETTPSEAGTFVAGQLQIVKDVCGGDMEGYVLESGWPSSCAANGVATCSTADQETAISSLKAELGSSIVFFSFSDDDWKDNGSCECEQHWGCGQLF